MRDLTVLILTFNERENIGRCLDRLGGAERMVVIDSFSTDETCEIAPSPSDLTSSSSSLTGRPGMPGRRRTGSSPSSTSISRAV